MAYLLAVWAAMANALTTIMQRMGVETAPSSARLRWSLVAHAVRRKVWLAGFGVMTCGFLLQFVALHFGRLSAVQPVLALELPFLVIILGVWFGHRLTWREWTGALMAAAGLATFLDLAQPGGGLQQPDLGDWILVSTAVVVCCSVSAGLAHVGSAAWRAAMFGISAAVLFAFTAAVMKEMNADISQGWSGVFLSWPPYVMSVTGLTGLFLAQNAFHAGPVTASQSAMVILDPLASIVIGIGLFGDQLQTAGARGPCEALGLLVLLVGLFWLARSPLVAEVKAEGGAQAHILSSKPRGLPSRRRARAGRENADSPTSVDPLL
jgi:drug/metabolite transporter (DMT)-like permease